MSTNGNAFNAKKGWAVASLIGKVKNKFWLGHEFNLSLAWRFICAIVLALAFSRLANATGTDLLASQKSTVDATFGSGSSLITWFYIAEIIMGLVIYIKSRQPLVFVGIVLAVIFTRIAFAIVS